MCLLIIWLFNQVPVHSVREARTSQWKAVLFARSCEEILDHSANFNISIIVNEKRNWQKRLKRQIPKLRSLTFYFIRKDLLMLALFFSVETRSICHFRLRGSFGSRGNWRRLLTFRTMFCRNDTNTGQQALIIVSFWYSARTCITNWYIVSPLNTFLVRNQLP